jgi:hypothetical protein
MTSRGGMAAALAVGAVLVASGGLGLRAQEGRSKRVEDRPAGRASVPVYEALNRPFDIPFGDETTLEAAAKTLSQALGAPVVLDLAALKRLEITPNEHVKLDLKGVRLKTGLKLLLDQVNMTYKVVPEDNLLILTDERGAGDETSHILKEVKELHRDIHALQDAVDDLTDMIAPPDGPAIRHPTIIEEMPDDKGKPKPKDDEPVGRVRPGI